VDIVLVVDQRMSGMTVTQRKFTEATGTGLGLNPVFRGERPLSKRLVYGTVLKLLLY
jgi:hypothetical protein